MFAHNASTRFGTVATWAIAAVLIAQIAQLAMQTTIAFDDLSAAFIPSRVIDVVAQSDWGRFWSWRFSAAILAALAVFAARQSIARTRSTLESDETEELPMVTETPFGIAAIALGGVYLLLIALTSHNAATPTDIRWFAIATDLIHIISATIWVGGIAYLLVASIHAIRSGDQQSRNALVQIAARFAPVAIFASIILVASGIASSLVQVTAPEALMTPYGGVLIFKVLLLVALIVSADKNNRVVSKASRLTTSEIRPLTRGVTVELAIAFTILLATAGLASLEPARQYAERTGIGVVDYISRTESIDGANIRVKLDPGTTGVNILSVNITDDDNNPFAHADEIRARLKYFAEDFGEDFMPLDNIGPGEWQLDEITVGVAGPYQLDVAVVRSDSFDSFVSTRFIASSPIIPSDYYRPSPKTVMAAIGLLIGVIGVGYVVATSFILRSFRPIRSPHLGISIFIATIGILVVVNAFTVGIGLPTEGKGNPFPLSQESVDIGRASYITACATCHGDTGVGDGPAGLALNPPPADLAIHVPLHTDNELYGFIADGIAGTPMVAQSGNLTSDEIWHLVNYIRTMGE